MRMYFAHIPVLGDGTEVAELNRFLASHRVLSIERQLIADGPASAWAICVTYVQGDGPALPTRRGRLDYRELLPQEEFAVFVRLRELRKQLAEQDGVPAYALFTNEQLAAMIRARAHTPTALAEIPGVGPARVEKYGEPFLDVLKQWTEPNAPAQPDLAG